MIQLKSAAEIEKIRRAGRIVAIVLDALRDLAKPGFTTFDIDKKALAIIQREDAESAFKGYRGYPANICTSVNEVVIHGIPGPYRLKEGDIIGLDVGVRYQGYCGDGAKTIAVGAVNADVKRLLGAAQTALEAAIIKAAEGNRIGDISNAIQTVAEENGFSVVREYVGHGIGSSVHEEPSIPNFGKAGTGLRIKTGMALAIETMVNMGGHQIRVLDDGWTVVTADGKPSAHFEHTVAVTENGPQVLTTL